MKIRLIEAPLAIPRYRQVRLPAVAAELSPYAEIEINDPNVEPLDLSDVGGVGFTAQTYNAPRAIHLSQKFRQRGIKTFLGGPYALSAREGALEHFDAVVIGEIEGLGERLVRDLRQGALRGVYQNETPPDLATVRQPRRDLQRAERYYWINYPIEFSRGCPHACSFCYGPLAFKTFRPRPLDAIAADLDRWDYGLVEAVDLHFAANSAHAIEVCRLLESFPGFGWYGEATLLSMDNPKLLKAMERSNCKMVFVGLESIESAALAASNKSFNQVDGYRRIIRMMQDHGIFVHAGVMWGLDGATPECFARTAEFCEETGIYLASSNIVAFFPGLPAHDALVKEGRLQTTDLRDYDSMRITVEPRGMSREQVIAGTREFNRRFYSYRSIFIRSLQHANYRLAQLYDFWGLNLIYRAYFQRWCKNLGSRETPWPASAAERDTFPYVGGRLPFIYTLAHWQGRFFQSLYAAWDRTATPTSFAATLVGLLLVAALAVIGAGAATATAADHWPVPWPPLGIGLTAFVAAGAVATVGLSRLARAGPSPAKAALGLLLILAPLLAAIRIQPATATGWRFAAAAATGLFALKAWSVLRGGPSATKHLFRVATFIYLYPTLDFANAFRHASQKVGLTRHLYLSAVGAGRFGAGLAALWGLFFFHLYVTHPAALTLGVGAIGRFAALYLLLRGTLEYWTAYWRMVGYRVPEPFGARPFGPGAAELWRAWMRPWSLWLHRHLYTPLGGHRRPLVATPLTFLFSGGVVGLTLAPVIPDHLPWEVLAFFAAQGLIVGVEKQLARPRLRWLFALLAWVVAAAAAPFLFALTDRIFL